MTPEQENEALHSKLASMSDEINILTHTLNTYARIAFTQSPDASKRLRELQLTMISDNYCAKCREFHIDPCLA
jgi:hypothetical protein